MGRYGPLTGLFVGPIAVHYSASIQSQKGGSPEEQEGPLCHRLNFTINSFTFPSHFQDNMKKSKTFSKCGNPNTIFKIFSLPVIKRVGKQFIFNVQKKKKCSVKPQAGVGVKFTAQTYEVAMLATQSKITLPRSKKQK